MWESWGSGRKVLWGKGRDYDKLWICMIISRNKNIKILKVKNVFNFYMKQSKGPTLSS